MLSEAYRLSRALVASGVTAETTSGDVRVPGAMSGVRARVMIGMNGRLVGVGSISKEFAVGLWTIMEGNHNSFPVVRLKTPLFSLPADHELWGRIDAAARSKAKDAEIRALLLENCDALPISSEFGNAIARLREPKAIEVRARSLRSAPRVAELCERFIQGMGDPAEFSRSLRDRLATDLFEGRLELLDFTREIFLGRKPSDTNGGRSSTSVQLALDLDSGLTIYTRETKRQISAARVQTEGDANVGDCAYSGPTRSLLAEPFPKVRVPELGRDFPLLSMFKKAQCNVRYGLTDENIVPISEAVVEQAHSALSHLFEERFRDKNWRGVASGQFTVERGRKTERKDLLVAYVFTPADPPAVTPIISADPSRDYGREAKAVIEALNGVGFKNPAADRLELFILRAVSKGQAQAVYSERPLVRDFLNGARAWQENQGKRPETILDGRTTARKLLSPEQAAQITSLHWTRDASRGNLTAGLLLGDALDLLIRHPGRANEVARRALDLLAAHATTLLLKVAAKLRSGEKPSPKETALGRRALALVAICLAQLEEPYMNEPAYLVGRMLAVADKLHIQYCRVVRHGDIPPSLIGNGLFGSALENPVSALSVLADRMRIYVGWAQTVSVPDPRSDSKNRIPILTAKKTLREFAEIESLLDGRLDDIQRTGEIERAQMLLGYLSRAKVDETDQTTENEPEDDKDE